MYPHLFVTLFIRYPLTISLYNMGVTPQWMFIQYFMMKALCVIGWWLSSRIQSPFSSPPWRICLTIFYFIAPPLRVFFPHRRVWCQRLISSSNSYLPRITRKTTKESTTRFCLVDNLLTIVSAQHGLALAFHIAWLPPFPPTGLPHPTNPQLQSNWHFFTNHCLCVACFPKVPWAGWIAGSVALRLYSLTMLNTSRTHGRLHTEAAAQYTFCYWCSLWGGQSISF